jgi:lysophospholipase L1-like esterase
MAISDKRKPVEPSGLVLTVSKLYYQGSVEDTNVKRRDFVMGVAGAPGPDLFRPIKDLLSGSAHLTWVFTGDSITHGALHTMGWRSYPEHFAERVRWELQRLQDVVINTGISGDRMSRLLQNDDWRVWRFQPDVVSLMMGMNDCVDGPRGRFEYRRNLATFLKGAEQHRAKLLLHAPNPIIFAANARRHDLPAYVDELRGFAHDHGLPLIDHYQYWLGAHKPDDLVYLLNDGAIHPNQYGHIEMAKLMFQKLGIFDPESRTCRLFVP